MDPFQPQSKDLEFLTIVRKNAFLFPKTLPECILKTDWFLCVGENGGNSDFFIFSKLISEFTKPNLTTQIYRLQMRSTTRWAYYAVSHYQSPPSLLVHRESRSDIMVVSKKSYFNRIMNFRKKPLKKQHKKTITKTYIYGHFSNLRNIKKTSF